MLSMQSTTVASPAPRRAADYGGVSYIGLSEWQEFVEGHPDSMAFHHRNWIEALSRQYGYEVHIPCLKRGGEIEAAIPFMSRRSLLGRERLYCLPFSDYVGVLSSPHAAETLIAALVSDHPPCDYMSMRTQTPLANVPYVSDWVRHKVPLAGSFAEVSKRFKSSVQRNLHKAKRVGLQFMRRTDSDAMEAFYRLHVLTRRKHGVPVQPKRFFERLQTGLLDRGLAYVGLVLKGTNPVAGGIFLTFNGTVIYKYAASHPAALTDRPNDWLVCSALRVACEEGYRALDFGISDRHQAGLRRFKCNWAAVESDIYSVQLVGTAKKPIEEGRLFKLGSAVIRRSPPVVCRSLGELFYRFAN